MKRGENDEVYVGAKLRVDAVVHRIWLSAGHLILPYNREWYDAFLRALKVPDVDLIHE